jgi:predicted nuclease of predicted toxin-antitoxin system
VKVDEDLPTAIAVMFRRAGYEATTVVDEGLGGAADALVWQTVQKEQRFLVTADKGFADARVHPPGTHTGILLLRPDDDGIEPLVRLIQRVLAAGGIERLRGPVAVASPRGVRVRRS